MKSCARPDPVEATPLASNVAASRLNVIVVRGDTDERMLDRIVDAVQRRRGLCADDARPIANDLVCRWGLPGALERMGCV
jgi:hypothetical protein